MAKKVKQILAEIEDELKEIDEIISEEKPMHTRAERRRRRKKPKGGGDKPKRRRRRKK